MGIVLVVALILGIASQIPSSTKTSSSPYVEVDYTLTDWNSSQVSFSNSTYYSNEIEFNVTIINKGYSDAVQYPEFSLTVSGITYSGLNEYNTIPYGAAINNGGSVSGSVSFLNLQSIPVSEQYVLKCTMSFSNNIFSNPNVKCIQVG